MTHGEGNGTLGADARGPKMGGEEIMLVSLDSRKRVPLGKLLNGMSVVLFDAKIIDGKIVLEPMKVVPEREAWLYKNPKALASVKRGLKNAAKGEVVEFDPDKE